MRRHVVSPVSMVQPHNTVWTVGGPYTFPQVNRSMHFLKLRSDILLVHKNKQIENVCDNFTDILSE